MLAHWLLCSGLPPSRGICIQGCIRPTLVCPPPSAKVTILPRMGLKVFTALPGHAVALAGEYGTRGHVTAGPDDYTTGLKMYEREANDNKLSTNS